MKIKHLVGKHSVDELETQVGQENSRKVLIFA